MPNSTTISNMNFLDNIIQDPDTLDPTKVKLVYDRIATLLNGAYPEMDTAPNSVFGDFVVRPLTYLAASIEEAQDCILGDLDILKLARGEICNCEWAEAYLKGLGVFQSAPVTISAVRLTFSTDLTRTIPNTARLLFGGDTLVRFRTSQPSEIVILPSSAWKDDPDNNIYRLTKTSESGLYSVDLPVYGPAGGDVAANATATSDIADTNLQSIVLIHPLRPVLPPSDVKTAARQAGAFFPAGALTTRSSAEAFFRQRLGNLGAVSVTVPGDWETARGATNLFGISRGTVDIYLRGDTDPIEETLYVPVKLNTTTNDFRGRLATGNRVPLHILSVADGDDTFIPESTPESPDSGWSVCGTSTNTNRFPGLSAAFTQYEQLGIIIPEAFLDADNFADVFADEEIEGEDPDITLNLNGQFEGNVFSNSAKMRLRITGSAESIVVENTTTGEKVNTETEDVGGGTLRIITDDPLLQSWTQGITMDWELSGGAAPTDVTSFIVEYEGAYTVIAVTYEYDPILLEADALLRHDSLKGPNDILVRSPYPLYLTDLRVPYRTSSGNWVDTDLARTEILNVVRNSLFPETFDDSLISDALLYAGASSVGRISRAGTFYLTLAHYYTPDGKDPINASNTFTEVGRSSVFQSADTLLLEGAGQAGFDGLYIKTGIEDGRPAYRRNGDPSGILLRWVSAGSRWDLGSNAYFSTDNVATPDLVVNWTANALPPAPSVTKVNFSFTRVVPLPSSTAIPEDVVRIDNSDFSQRSGERNVQTLLRSENLRIVESLKI